MLRGTGSNVYNASLAQALARLGHDVHLLCQDRGAGALPWVDRVGSWREGELQVEPAPESSSEPGEGRGTVTVYLPEIGDLLPVYVFDRYEGFEVKTFADLTEAELDSYLDANVAAVRDVVAAVGGVDAALANHLVMGPAILARAGVPFAAKIHGSALEFTVRPNPDRFLPYAREGMDGRGGRPGRLAATRRRSCGRRSDDPDLPAEDAARAARRGHGAVRRRHAAARGRRGARARRARSRRRGRPRRVGRGHRRGRAGARALGRRRGPARRSSSAR